MHRTRLGDSLLSFRAGWPLQAKDGAIKHGHVRRYQSQGIGQGLRFKASERRGAWSTIFYGGTTRWLPEARTHLGIFNRSYYEGSDKVIVVKVIQSYYSTGLPPRKLVARQQKKFWEKRKKKRRFYRSSTLTWKEKKKTKQHRTGGGKPGPRSVKNFSVHLVEGHRGNAILARDRHDPEKGPQLEIQARSTGTSAVLGSYHALPKSACQRTSTGMRRGRGCPLPDDKKGERRGCSSPRSSGHVKGTLKDLKLDIRSSRNKTRF